VLAFTPPTMPSRSPSVDPTLRLSPVLGPHHTRYLTTLWLLNPGHFPTVESRQRWAAAHDLLPVAVHTWYRAKRQAMQRARQRIPREEFELGLPEPRLQPTLEELEEMRRPRVKPQPRKEKAERFPTAPAPSCLDGEQRVTRAAARRLRGQSLDSEVIGYEDVDADVDGAWAARSPSSSPVSEFSTLSLDYMRSGRSEYSATEYENASECDVDEDAVISTCGPRVLVDGCEGIDCCDACQIMVSAGLVSESIPDAPSNIWDAPYDFAFWAHFEANALAPTRLNSMRDAYEQSGLASWCASEKGRVYEDFVWNMDGGAVSVKIEDGAEEMVVNGSLFAHA
ncbi:unnamed protein product, partial [Peniophora sp. CBMAI 1063]